MKRPPRNYARAGFTLLEIMMACIILGILGGKLVMVMGDAMQTSNEETAQVFVEDQARKLMRQIAFAVMGSDRETLAPTIAAPLDSDDIRYRINLGLQDGEVVWSDEEMIELEEDAPQVAWSRNPETVDELRVVWSNAVAPFLEGEIPNGMDDNGNGLIDEKGLSFVVDGNAVQIRMTLEAPGPDGNMVPYTIETVVTCRNLEQPE